MKRTLIRFAFASIIITWVVRIIGLIILLLLVAGGVAYCQVNRTAQVPDVEKAPWVIQTYSNDAMRIPSRIYLAEMIDYDGDTPVIKNYWRLDGGRYIFVKGKKEFPVAEYGKIDIERRR